MTTEKQHQFYLAGSYSIREGLQYFAASIELLSGWKCNARWLAGRHEGEEPHVCAREDLEDIRACDALLLYHGSSTRGGKWVEMGYALALEKPVVFYIPIAEANTPLPVFCHHRGVTVVNYGAGVIPEVLQNIELVEAGHAHP